MNIRLASEADLEEMTAVLVGASPLDPVYPYRFPGGHLYSNEFAALCRRKCAEYLESSTVVVCEMPTEDGSPTTCVVAFSAWDMPAAAQPPKSRRGSAVGTISGHVFLKILLTHPRRQRRGAGTALASWGIAQARALGVPTTVFASPMGLALYRRLGFREVGRFRVQLDGEPDFLEIPALVRPAGVTGGMREAEGVAGLGSCGRRVGDCLGGGAGAAGVSAARWGEGTDGTSKTPPETSGAAPGPNPELGPMATRLREATEDALLTGGRAGRRAIEEAGFSEELKAQLLDKIASAKFNHENSAALAQAGITSRIPDSAGLGTRAMASAQPWTGQETTEDAVLRMLDDARKPLGPGLRGKSKPIVPQPVDMRIRRETGVTPGLRAAGARDKAQAYAGMGIKDAGLTDKEREDMRREFRERFAPGARAMPNTVSGLAALANERIEDAIARGQFKDIPRGKGIERDRRADNPFIDTTEYIMNKMIKRQDLVPPWIEKQQEVAKAAGNFRGRLRNDWKRHAARMISARGGTLEQQIARATAYALAEEAHNPRRRRPDQIAVPTTATDDAVMMKQATTVSPHPTIDPVPSTPSSSSPSPPTPTDPLPTTPFRDPAWQAAEASYHALAIANLNSLTRAYNLMAPELARKPYFSLDRELRACFADVAPLVAGEIRARAAGGGAVNEGVLGLKGGGGFGAMAGGGGAGGGVGELFSLGGVGSRVSVAEGREKEYGMREFWRDFWGRFGKR
ncbi:hypothetical protein B0I37DRAFT_310697 [Chaetomium sp. MPI-CAGE-AT-0009]|nr:hypothetical protein B0I37DRAFT_310697 [Chaetomium sp. MPI-CAGE-AT-0009]